MLDACDVESKARMVVLGAKLAHAEATVALRDAELAQSMALVRDLRRTGAKAQASMNLHCSANVYVKNRVVGV